MASEGRLFSCRWILTLALLECLEDVIEAGGRRFLCGGHDVWWNRWWKSGPWGRLLSSWMHCGEERLRRLSLWLWSGTP